MLIEIFLVFYLGIWYNAHIGSVLRSYAMETQGKEPKANLMYNFIVNPNAGSGRGLKAWKAIARYLERHNIEYDVFFTRSSGDARTRARELTEGAREPSCIVVVGGDGTVNETVDGISFHSSVSVGYIPAGTGNDLSRSLRMPAGAVRCLKAQMGSRVTMLDYGVVSFGAQEVFHRRFLVSAGIGFDAAVCRAIADSNSGLRRILSCLRLGKLSYVFVGMRQFFQCRPSKGYIILDGVRKVEFNHILFVSCHIHPSEGGGFFFAPKADGRDGQMNVCVFSHRMRFRLIPVLISAALGRHRKGKGLRNYTCREAKIHTEVPLPVHVDGEFCGAQTDIQAECIRQKIRMMF